MSPVNRNFRNFIRAPAVIKKYWQLSTGVFYVNYETVEVDLTWNITVITVEMAILNSVSI